MRSISQGDDIAWLVLVILEVIGMVIGYRLDRRTRPRPRRRRGRHAK